MNHWTCSFALTGVVPAACDAEAGEAEALASFVFDEDLSDSVQHSRKHIQVFTDSNKKSIGPTVRMPPP